jgi:hypothetical protein
VIGSELHAERREHDVEAPVLEREALRVTLDPRDVDAGLVGPAPGDAQEIGNQVEAGDPRAGPRGWDRGVPRARRDVEDHVPRADADLGDDLVSQRQHEPVRDLGVVAGAPGRAVPILGRGGVGLGGGHRVPPRVGLLGLVVR